MKKVAIITRTKGRPIFLKRLLDSVARQSFKDYEHVIVNDSGLKLDINDLLSNLPEDYRKSIRIIDRPQASYAPDTIFSESVDYSKSKYVAIHDDDDTWHKDFLKLTVDYLDNNEEIGGVVVRTDKIIEKIKNDKIIQISKKPYMPELKSISLYQQCFENLLTPISFIYRRNFYEKIGKYDNSLPVCGDWEFGIRFLTNYDVDFIDPGFALANYHHRKVSRLYTADNSFAEHSHRYYSNKIRNLYLRKELSEGKLGVGLIMNQLHYNQSQLAQFVKKILPKFLIQKMKNKILD